MSTIPLDVIDPDKQHREWSRAFEWHLDMLPPIMDAIITTTLPHVRATQTDRARITGGGHVDNMTGFLSAFDQSKQGAGANPGGATADAQHLWGGVIEYVTAITAWLNTSITVPWAPMLPPTLDSRPNPDPLTARAVALITVGWLIDNADHIEQLTELEPFREELFAVIRRLRGRYGVHPNPRKPRARCTVCGTLSVAITWIDNPNGSAKPVRAAHCRTCGQVYTDRGA